MNIWKENKSVIGKIRRASRAVMVWMRHDAWPVLVVSVVLGHLVTMTLITMGEYPSGPVAALSTSPHVISSDVTSSTGHDPYTIASRVDHGHFVGGLER